MNNNKTNTIPTIKPIVKIDNSTKQALLNEFLEESQVTIYCSCSAVEKESFIQICDSTFLFPKDSTHISKMIHAINIPRYPNWLLVEKGTTVHFVLIFTKLPKSCIYFDLIESIPLSGPFKVKNIKRNKTDVYHLDLSKAHL